MEGIVVMMIIFLLLMLAIVVVLAIGLWKIFEKAGEEGWKSLIPIYNLVILLDIVGKPRWWMLVMVLNVITAVVKAGSGDEGLIVFIDFGANVASLGLTIWMFNMLSKSFGKSEGFTAGLVFFPFVTLPMLGFGKEQYLGPYGDPARFAAYQANRGEGFDFEQDKLA